MIKLAEVKKASLGPLLLLLKIKALVENNELGSLKPLKFLGSQSSVGPLRQLSMWEPLPG